MSDCLIVFTRFPEPGKTKTRMIPALGPEGAADLQRQMARQTINRCRDFLAHHPSALQIFHAGGSQQQMACWLGADLRFFLQSGGSLGERMHQSFAAAFAAGMDRVVVIGTDCPHLETSHLQEAFAHLATHDLVLGPAVDGGYYLIGLRRLRAELFADIPWGTADVLTRTLQIAGQQQLTVHLLPELADIDRPEDLPLWEPAAVLADEPGHVVPLSIIIPTLNEEGTIASVLAALQDIPGQEVIVVDGGSSDRTVELVRARGGRVLPCSKGRARQLNAGAAAARGEILLFLHADTRLPQSYWGKIKETLAQPQVAAGCFSLHIDAPGIGMRFIETLVNLRTRWLQLPYGDQAFFIAADTFAMVGGFPQTPIMEDVELIRRLRRYGSIIQLPAAVVTSGRRWQRLGIIRTTLINQLVFAGYYLGIDPHRLARWYRQEEKK
ncbi:MAG: TIGR04283 family arsenosugar biosynthesis glycosyltransferase [Deltaproteobacteria bacterium]|nr:TIGR04283 family arsenosugar biosynthesis glycosyltransferase [Candidatus Anaeroferrophillus wilburensis]MBN2887931.1 TIGR04283 family arsenosugar biosynthesis glycosyltransferase [Deltaproteobacteria bacterium]